MCRACKNKGSLGKRLFKLVRSNEQWLGSKCLLGERQRLIDSLLEDKQRSTCKQEARLHKGKTSPVQHQLLVHTSESVSVTQHNEPIATFHSVLDVESDDHSSESENEGNNASQDQRIQPRDYSTIGIQGSSLKSGQVQW